MTHSKDEEPALRGFGRTPHNYRPFRSMTLPADITVAAGSRITFQQACV